MIFSEDNKFFSLFISPLTSDNELEEGLWMILAGISEIPPHIALINEGKYYSLSAHKVDCGSSLERFISAISRKHIPTLFIQMNRTIPYDLRLTTYDLQSIYKNLQPLGGRDGMHAVSTCLTPIKEFFATYYSSEFTSVKYVFELLALAENKGMIKKCYSLLFDNRNSNIVTLPKYNMEQIRERIEELNSLRTSN